MGAVLSTLIYSSVQSLRERHRARVGGAEMEHQQQMNSLFSTPYTEANITESDVDVKVGSKYHPPFSMMLEEPSLLDVVAAKLGTTCLEKDTLTENQFTIGYAENGADYLKSVELAMTVESQVEILEPLDLACSKIEQVASLELIGHKLLQSTHLLATTCIENASVCSSADSPVTCGHECPAPDLSDSVEVADVIKTVISSNAPHESTGPADHTKDSDPFRNFICKDMFEYPEALEPVDFAADIPVLCVFPF